MVPRKLARLADATMDSCEDFQKGVASVSHAFVKCSGHFTQPRKSFLPSHVDLESSRPIDSGLKTKETLNLLA